MLMLRGSANLALLCRSCNKLRPERATGLALGGDYTENSG